ncbi:hypothetical protein Droror1_Dr00015203 [Drosera rotundifolia]
MDARPKMRCLVSALLPGILGRCLAHDVLLGLSSAPWHFGTLPGLVRSSAAPRHMGLCLAWSKGCAARRGLGCLARGRLAAAWWLALAGEGGLTGKGRELKDLKTELKIARETDKESLKNGVSSEREHYTQIQWDMEELRKRCLELELRLKDEQDEEYFYFHLGFDDRHCAVPG